MHEIGHYLSKSQPTQAHNFTIEIHIYAESYLLRQCTGLFQKLLDFASQFTVQIFAGSFLCDPKIYVNISKSYVFSRNAMN